LEISDDEDRRRKVILPSIPSVAQLIPDASQPVADTLAALGVNPETGLTRTDVDSRRDQHGYNEVLERQEHLLLKFLKKFWGLSAWMLEAIIILSFFLQKYSDLAVVSVLLAGALASKEANQDPIDLAFLAAAKEQHVFDGAGVAKAMGIPLGEVPRK